MLYFILSIICGVKIGVKFHLISLNFFKLNDTGVADYIDDCPTVAGLTSLKGCKDADGDGIADNLDKCPDTAKGAKVDEKGCPVDSDGDDIPDYLDKCPTVAGLKENNGCPIKEAVETEKELTPEQVNMQNIKIVPVHFAFDKSYLTDYSKGVLEKLIKTLNSDKDFYVNMYGFTDSVGSDEYNIKLSQERVDSVIKYLIFKGISRDRIIHQKALGKAKPIASNTTKAGRLKNRRVEFEIFILK